MSRAQELIEEALRIAHQEEGINIFNIQDALKAVLKDVDEMVEDCRIIKKNRAHSIPKTPQRVFKTKHQRVLLNL